jgi:hypothetical protein
MKLNLGQSQVLVLQPPAKGDNVAELAWQSAWGQLPPDFPPQQRPDWPLAGPRQDTVLLRIESNSTGEVAYVGLRRHRLRAQPWAWYLQIPKLGIGLHEWAVKAALAAVRQLAVRWWRVARVRVELCLLSNPSCLLDVEQAGKSLGFEVATPQEYEHTILVDLPRDSHSVSPSFHRNVFKNARKLERAGHVVRLIEEERFCGQLAALYRETMGRTAAQVEAPDMAAIVRASRMNPDRFRLVGLFRDGRSDTASLLAFRWCGCSGRYAYDLLAASTRLVDEAGQVPMMPAIMLDAFAWARSQGAELFDFGGVVLEGDPRAPRLAGITRFKQQFGGSQIRVGIDLLLHPRPAWEFGGRILKILKRAQN